MDLLRLTPSELQLERHKWHTGRSEVSDIKEGAGGQFSPSQRGGQRLLSLF